MAALSDREIKQALDELRILLGVNGARDVRITDGFPVSNGTEVDGSLAYDATTNNLFIFRDGSYRDPSAKVFIVTHTITSGPDPIGYVGIPNTPQWDLDVLDAVFVFSGVPYVSTLSLAFGTIAVIYYEVITEVDVTEEVDGVDVTTTTLVYTTTRVAGQLIDIDGTATWVNPGQFTDGGPAPVEIINLEIAPDTIYSTNVAGGVKSRAVLNWKYTTASFEVPAARTVIVEYKLSADEDFFNFGQFFGPPVQIPDLIPGVYDFRVQAVSALGASSDVVIMTDVTVSGLLLPPLRPTGFFINNLSQSATLVWDQTTDLDVLSGGSIQIRYSTEIGSGVNWSTSQVLVQAIAGTSTTANVHILTGTYLLKFVDSSGVESTLPAVVPNTYQPAGFNLIATNVQEPAFAGVKTNCSVVNDRLVLTLGETEMTYDFDNFIDLRTLKSVRVIPASAVNIFGGTDTVCLMTSICDRMIFCGEQVDGQVTFLISITETDPDPASNPVWTEFEPLVIGDVRARGIRIRLVGRTEDPISIMRFSSIGVSLDTTDLTITGSVDTSDEGETTVTYPDAGFYTGISGTSLPQLGTQIIGGAVGDQAIVGASTATGFTISVFNNGSRVERLINYQVIGQ